MPIQQWSDGILLVELGDEPQFSEDMQSLTDLLDKNGPMCVVANVASVKYLNSSSLAALLRVRQRLVAAGKHMRLCSIPDSVWGILLVTGLDKVFDCCPDVSSALASLQLEP